MQQQSEVVYNANINAIGLENLLVLLIYYPTYISL